MTLKTIFLLISIVCVCNGRNIVLIIADDLDYVLDGMVKILFSIAQSIKDFNFKLIFFYYFYFK